MTKDIQQVAVLGAGTMGAGIAQVCATAGLRVALRDVAPAVLDKAVAAMGGSLEKLESKGKLEPGTRARALAAVRTTTELADAVANVDLVIEAIPERLDWKIATFRELDEAAPPTAVLATNTSSLPVTEIAGATKDPSRVVGLHFFNPVPVMELVEIVCAMQTSDETVAAARALSTKLGKRSILVKDVPGFATSRLGVALAAEAIRMVESGVASPEDIDTAMKLGYRHPMGPLELTDLVGCDVRLAILDHLHREVGDQFRAPPLLRQMVRAGKLGRKTGEGFYKYSAQ